MKPSANTRAPWRSSPGSLRHSSALPRFGTCAATRISRATSPRRPRAIADNGLLQLQFANVLRRTGDLAGSELLLRDLIARAGPAPELRSSLATLLHAAGRLQEAEVEARAAVSGRPTDASIVHNWVAVLLSLGRADDALPFIRAERARAPLDSSWIADEATAARIMGDPAYSVLYDYDRLVRVYDLEPPPGWRSMAELNAALETHLMARHALVATRSIKVCGSALRRWAISQRDPDPAIQAVLQAFLEPIADYRAKLGDEADHPLSARNKGPVALRRLLVRAAQAERFSREPPASRRMAELGLLRGGAGRNGR